MKLDRLLGILTTLLKYDCVTAPFLAEKYEVTRRTISRDIDALCQAGIPIITRQGAGGGISIAKGYKLDKSVLTTFELSDILAAIKGIGTVSGRKQTEQIFDKLSLDNEAVAPLQESIVIDLASHYKDSLTTKIELIKQSVFERKVITFDYYSEKGEKSRRIEPYFITFQWAAWYVFGYCLEKSDWRMFKLTRLWELNICDETYTIRQIPPQKRDFNDRFCDDKILKALFDPSVKFQLIETYGLNCYTVTEDGRLLLEIGYTNRVFTISWLLGFGSKARVLSPPDMAEEIQEIAKKIIQAYK